MDGVALKGLTVDFHEPGFVGQIAGENNQPFWFQMSDNEKQKAGSPWGPANPQALNRYSYVQNNPMGATDPSGHNIKLNREQAIRLRRAIGPAIEALQAKRSSEMVGFALIGIGAAGLAAMAIAGLAAAVAAAAIAGLTEIAVFLAGLANMLQLDPNGTQEALDLLNYMDRELELFIDYAVSCKSGEIMEIRTEEWHYKQCNYCTISVHGGSRVIITWGGQTTRRNISDSLRGYLDGMKQPN